MLAFPYERLFMILSESMKKGAFKPSTKAEKRVIDFVRYFCQQNPFVLRVMLFGSRTRRDYNEKSDFDFAFQTCAVSEETWARFALELRERIPTLCGADIVHLEY